MRWLMPEYKGKVARIRILEHLAYLSTWLHIRMHFVATSSPPTEQFRGQTMLCSGQGPHPDYPYTQDRGTQRVRDNKMGIDQNKQSRGVVVREHIFRMMQVLMIWRAKESFTVCDRWKECGILVRPIMWEVKGWKLTLSLGALILSWGICFSGRQLSVSSLIVQFYWLPCWYYNCRMLVCQRMFHGLVSYRTS